MITRAQIAAEALSWVGTPFHWQASVKGVGCDCKGLVVGVARELGMSEAASQAGLCSNYRVDFRQHQLIEGLRATLKQVESVEIGDVIAFEVGDIGTGPRHLGILTAPGRMVHCYGGGLIKKVIESRLHPRHRIHSFWTWPSLGE